MLLVLFLLLLLSICLQQALSVTRRGQDNVKEYERGRWAWCSDEYLCKREGE